MKVSELTELLGVDDKHIYRMAARGQLPSFRVGGAVRFDPHEVANWLLSRLQLRRVHAGVTVCVGIRTQHSLRFAD